MLHLSGERGWQQVEFHKLLVFQVVQNFVLCWRKLSLRSLWDQRMNQQVPQLYGVTAALCCPPPAS